jgi:uncharacterized protein YjlB
MSTQDAYVTAPPQEVLHPILKDDGIFPNSELPLLVYRQALPITPGQPQAIEELFERNGWTNSWRNGIYNYHHYHSTTHEVLGILSGQCTVQLGGDSGVTITVMAGDVVIIPAGVAHKNLESSNDFVCVGAYPNGRSYDMNYGKADERARAVENIRKVPLPATDPVYGKQGPLFTHWM